MSKIEEYFRPSSAAEALALKHKFGEHSGYLAGGSDLLVHRPEKLTIVIDIRHAGLNTISRTSDELVIGGAALLCDIEREVAGVGAGMLSAATRETAPWLVRNAATMAGNIANASPSADSVPALMVLDAELTLLGDQDERVPIADILDRPHRTTLGDRLIQDIRISTGAADRVGHFTKLARSKSDIAQVNVAVSAVLDGEKLRDVRIALGSVSPTPMRCRSAEKLVEGRRLSPLLLRQIETTVAREVHPISDWRASAEYRRRVSGVLARRALGTLVPGGNPN